MKTENGFKILAPFLGISQVGCRKSLFWSFLRSLDTLHVVGEGKTPVSHIIDIEGEEKARNHFRGLVSELKAWGVAAVHTSMPENRVSSSLPSTRNEVFIPETKFLKIFAQLAGSLMSWLFTRELPLPIHDHADGIRFKAARFNFHLCEWLTSLVVKGLG